MSCTGPVDCETWLGLTADPLPVEEALRWAGRPDCGALVLFSGNARDHSEGRSGVTGLAYEAYEEQALPRLERVADEARRRWPAIGRVVLVHRVGPVAIGEAAVVVVVSAPHRGDAFEAGRFCIDAVKATVPIWKFETWGGDEQWSSDSQHLVDLDDLVWPPAEDASEQAGQVGGHR